MGSVCPTPRQEDQGVPVSRCHGRRGPHAQAGGPRHGAGRAPPRPRRPAPPPDRRPCDTAHPRRWTRRAARGAARPAHRSSVPAGGRASCRGAHPARAIPWQARRTVPCAARTGGGACRRPHVLPRRLATARHVRHGGGLCTRQTATRWVGRRVWSLPAPGRLGRHATCHAPAASPSRRGGSRSLSATTARLRDFSSPGAAPNARLQAPPRAGARELGKDKAQYLTACFLILPV